MTYDSFEIVRMRNTWVEIDLDCIVHNLNEARKILPANTRITAVIKADAYGHGAVETAGALIENNVDMLAVACLSEALELRRKFVDIPILILGYTPDVYFPIAVKNHIDLTLFSLEQAQKLSYAAEGFNETAVVHIKLDTGLNRLGLKPGPQTANIIAGISKLRNIKVDGIFTHLALITEERDREQFRLFENVVRETEERGIHIPLRHVNDSNGMVTYPEFDLEMVRLGGFIYGVTNTGIYKNVISLKPAMTFKTQITRIEEIKEGECVGYGSSFIAHGERRIATLAAGYSDGYMRSLSDKGEVGIRGKRAKVIGLICMDQCMVDVTDIPEAQVEDEVLLFGKDKNDSIHVNELAQKINTNRNEILGGISRRVPRVYISKSRVVNIVDYLHD